MKKYPRAEEGDKKFYEGLQPKKRVPAPEEEEYKGKREGICPNYRKCSGCQMQNLPYEDQLRWKQAPVRRRFLCQFRMLQQR